MTPLQKLPKNVGDLGKLMVTRGFKKWPKAPINCPIWSHWTCKRAINLRLRCPKKEEEMEGEDKHQILHAQTFDPLKFFIAFFLGVDVRERALQL